MRASYACWRWLDRSGSISGVSATFPPAPSPLFANPGPLLKLAATCSRLEACEYHIVVSGARPQQHALPSYLRLQDGALALKLAHLTLKLSSIIQV